MQRHTSLTNNAARRTAMKKIYTNPTAEIIFLKQDVLTASEEWIPGENETERADCYDSYPNY